MASYLPALSVFKELFLRSLFTPRSDAGAGKLLILKLKPHKEGTMLLLAPLRSTKAEIASCTRLFSLYYYSQPYFFILQFSKFGIRIHSILSHMSHIIHHYSQHERKILFEALLYHSGL